MADLYTIFKWRPELIHRSADAGNRIKIGIIGVPHRMRTVRSLLKILSVFPYVFSDVYLFSAEDHREDQLFLEVLRMRGLKIKFSRMDFDQLVPQLDVVYINSIAWVGDGFETYGKHFRLTPATPFKDTAIVLHPLARGDELAAGLDHTSHNWYFSQARGAVFIRMALLTCLVHRKGRVLDVI
jgi:aspartate carbamoyltransferase catalytic subunit